MLLWTTFAVGSDMEQLLRGLLACLPLVPFFTRLLLIPGLLDMIDQNSDAVLLFEVWVIKHDSTFRSLPSSPPHCDARNINLLPNKMIRYAIVNVFFFWSLIWYNSICYSHPPKLSAQPNSLVCWIFVLMYLSLEFMTQQLSLFSITRTSVATLIIIVLHDCA